MSAIRSISPAVPFLAATILLGAALLPAGQRAPIEPSAVVVQDVRIPMPDGVRLAGTLYLPGPRSGTASAKVAAVVSQDPYGADPAPIGRAFAARGLAFLKVSTRGTHASEGTLQLYLNDAKDGPHVVEWVARQPWASGAVGTWGVSYAGITQYATALGHPPHLTAQFIDSAADDYHDGAAWSGGALMVNHNLDHMIGQTLDLKRVQGQPELRRFLETERKDHLAEWLRLPASRQFELFAAVPETVQWAREWLLHPDYDAFWKQVGFNLREHVADYPDVPVFFVTGWMDHFERPTLRAYTGLRARGASSPMRLLVGPWRHQGTATSWNGQVEYGPDAAAPDLLGLATEWMARWLLPHQGETGAEKPVRIFVMGTGDGHRTPDGRLYHGGYWRDEDAWPLARARRTRFYLQAGGALSPELPGSSDPSAYAFDPANPVPTIFTRLGGGWDQRCLKESPFCKDTLPLATRPDVLVFRSEPQAADVEVTGPVAVTLYGSSSARDTDFTAKLIDEYPPGADFPAGFALILGDAILRARYRNSFERAELLESGQVYALSLELPATSNVFKKGHRIRLDVSSSNFPKWDVNPNTGEPIGFQTHTVVANNRIYHDPQHASFVELPVVPSGTPAGQGGRR